MGAISIANSRPVAAVILTSVSIWSLDHHPILPVRPNIAPGLRGTQGRRWLDSACRRRTDTAKACRSPTGVAEDGFRLHVSSLLTSRMCAPATDTRPHRRAPTLEFQAAHRRRSRCSFVPDHLGWWRVTSHAGEWCRLAAGDANGPRILTSPGLHVASNLCEHDKLTLPSGARDVLPRELYTRLSNRTPLVRCGTPSVWEAAATAVIRQVVHRDHARVCFGRVCDKLGTAMLIDGQPRHAFPTAEAVLAAGEASLRETGIGFKARSLVALARWSLDAHEHLDPHSLHNALMRVRGIGPWTASIAVCDVFSDYSFYPVEDLAIRAYAGARWRRNWPKAPAAFARAWRSHTAPHTASITAFLIADAVLSTRPARVP